jgi:hypothetical protein
MSITSSNSKRNQTSWKFGENTYYYANIPEEIKDLKVIENAKSIVDFALPQKFGPWGTQYYSHLTREYVLNLILHFYNEYKRFPHGDICIVDHWWWETPSWVTSQRSVRCFSDRKRGRNYTPGYWVHLPTLREVKKSKEVQHG